MIDDIDKVVIRFANANLILRLPLFFFFLNLSLSLVAPLANFVFRYENAVGGQVQIPCAFIHSSALCLPPPFACMGGGGGVFAFSRQCPGWQHHQNPHVVDAIVCTLYGLVVFRRVRKPLHRPPSSFLSQR